MQLIENVRLEVESDDETSGSPEFSGVDKEGLTTAQRRTYAS
jgi:hypothetical protein